VTEYPPTTTPPFSGGPRADRPLSLIVTADDFGIGRATSQGIIQAHLNGPVTCASLMAVTGDHVRSSIDLLRDAPNLEVGLHLVLTDCGEKPLVARRSSGLLDRDGRFLSNFRLWRRAFARRIDRLAVAEEITAQAALFKTLLGRLPAYVDCHHHAHQLPIIRGALIDVINKGLLPPITRITVEPPRFLRTGSTRVRRRAAHALGLLARTGFAKNGVRANDFYFGMISANDLDQEFPWAHYLSGLPGHGAIEWVVHPGLPDESLAGRDSYVVQRSRELDALTNPQGRQIWEPFKPALARKSALALAK
jgi:predicted glycoside hydrolase/deacetylase ChbG (UPF0249 family)